MSPPIGGTLWREQADRNSDEPFVVDGCVIPPGTHVGVNIYSIHHNEHYFPEPFVFKPERWLVDDNRTDADVDGNFGAFTPFSVGSRSCIGKAMAYLEASLVIAKTLWYFDFEKCHGSLSEVGAEKRRLRGGDGKLNEFQLHDVITSLHDGPYLTFKPRDNHFENLI
jgi:cytochrome P450